MVIIIYNLTRIIIARSYLYLHLIGGVLEQVIAHISVIQTIAQVKIHQPQQIQNLTLNIGISVEMTPLLTGLHPPEGAQSVFTATLTSLPSEYPNIYVYNICIPYQLLQYISVTQDLYANLCQVMFPIPIYYNNNNLVNYNYYAPIAFFIGDLPNVSQSSGSVSVTAPMGAGCNMFDNPSQASPFWSVTPTYGLYLVGNNPAQTAQTPDGNWNQMLDPDSVIPASSTLPSSVTFSSGLTQYDTYGLCVNCLPLAAFVFGPGTNSSYLVGSNSTTFSEYSQAWSELSTEFFIASGSINPNLYKYYLSNNTESTTFSNSSMLIYATDSTCQQDDILTLFYGGGYYTPVLNMPIYGFTDSSSTAKNITLQNNKPQLNTKQIRYTPPNVNPIVPEYTFYLKQNGKKICHEPVLHDSDLEITFECLLDKVFELNHIDIPGLLVPKFDFAILNYGTDSLFYPFTINKKNYKTYSLILRKKYLTQIYNAMESNGGVVCLTIYRGYHDDNLKQWQTTHFNFPFMLENRMYYSSFYTDNNNYKPWFVFGGYTYNLPYYGLSSSNKNNIDTNEILLINELKHSDKGEKIKRLDEIFFPKTTLREKFYLCVSPYVFQEKTHPQIKYYMKPYYTPLHNLPSFKWDS